MKRIDRDPEKFEVIDLYEAIARKRGLKLNDPAAHTQFLNQVSAGLTAGRDNPIILHGRRVEGMFEHVAAGLGKALAVKHEDSGDVCAADPDIQPPDFRLVLDDGAEIFVEVKNCHREDPQFKYTVKSSYLASIKKYAEVFARPLYIAIFWSQWRRWTLSALDDLEQGERPYITFLKAMKKSKMAMLGDVLIGTTPPLTLRVVADPARPRTIESNGQCAFTIGGIELYCADHHLVDPFEQKLAFYFMLNSDWPTEQGAARVAGDQFVHNDYVASPIEPVPNQGFQLLGFLSDMISRSYNAMTAEDGSVRSLSPDAEPGSLGIVIPAGYKSMQLPLWRFTVQPQAGGA